MTTINQSIRKMKISKLGSDNSLPTFRSNIFMEYKLHDDVPPSVSEGFFKEAYIKFLPYTTQDHYNRAQNNNSMPTIVLENSKLKATFYPKYGGRLASLFDKEKHKELLFNNPVFQPANLAIRNAWFSGGIEWNGPVFGHSLLTCSPIYFAKVN